ncbi:lantibiotic protection ABC transporter ATP-binding protein [Varibaculum prostatecancerukia]|uniref:lantibiotic protection ABC transporter ATP-binding protein n=1 Tax=Varibaculum prostatecancerukia TaxID=2811781 RepID=UPI001C005007|nr:lantibiotic protection ABC transporter ATP-binding protein [Varibaculum prostatecancerukia]
MADYILQTQSLSKKFGKQIAVNSIDVCVPRGKVYGLLGPNGAGKSTFLKMICGMIKPSSGSILFNNAPWNRSVLSEIGALIENAPLYPNLTAYENCRVRSLALGIEKSRIDEVLEIVGLSDTGKKKSGQFSMGMKQRLGIALALINHPQLLILDEPTNGLDPIAIKDLRGLIRGFAKQGTTVILSSHILSEVEQIADHVGIIAAGSLGFQGALRQGIDLEQLFMDVVSKQQVRL